MKPEPASTLGQYPGAVRKFERRDAPAVEKLLRKSPEATPWSLDSLEDLVHYGQVAWVIEIEGMVTGFLVARAVPPEAEILNLAVDSTKRRMGYAAALLRFALAEFPPQHVKGVFLEVRESNHPAISFYEKHGFVRNGLRSAYYQSPIEDAVLMMRALTG